MNQSTSNVHYRLLAQAADEMPGNRALEGKPELDITDRLCVPCAVVGNARQASFVSDDAVPLCSPHYEFYRLDQAERDDVVRLWSSPGARVGVLRLFGLYKHAANADNARPVTAIGSEPTVRVS